MLVSRQKDVGGILFGSDVDLEETGASYRRQRTGVRSCWSRYSSGCWKSVFGKEVYVVGSLISYFASACSYGWSGFRHGGWSPLTVCVSYVHNS